MAFPQVAATATGSDTTNVTSRDFNLPSGISAGNLLLIAWNCDASNAVLAIDTTSTVLTTSGWTMLLDDAPVTTFEEDVYGRANIAYKVAVGGETTVTITSSAAEAVSFVAARITGNDDTTAPAIGSISGINANPPALNPAGWDVEDTLWVAFGFFVSGSSVPTDPPTNYENLTFGNWANFASGTAVALATRENAVASEDADVFPLTELYQAGRAILVAVRPVASGPEEDLQDTFVRVGGTWVAVNRQVLVTGSWF